MSQLDELSKGPFPAFVKNELNPDAIELAPLPLPIEFASDMDSPTSFDSSTTVIVDCQEIESINWL